MEPFDLLALAADRRASREREARSERLWRRRRRIEVAPPAAAVGKPSCSSAVRPEPGRTAA